MNIFDQVINNIFFLETSISTSLFLEKKYTSIQPYQKYVAHLINITNNELPLALQNDDKLSNIYINHFRLSTVTANIDNKMIYVYLEGWTNMANNIHPYTFALFNENKNNIIYYNHSQMADAVNNAFYKCDNLKLEVYYINEQNDRINIEATSLFVEMYFC